MMAGLKDWLMAIVAVSVLISAVDSLTPAGGVKQVCRLVWGLVLVWVMLRPLSALQGVSLAGELEEYARKIEEDGAQLSEQAGQMTKSVIESHYAAYILDKAAQLGRMERVEVQCARSSDGLYLPRSVQLWGDLTDVAQSTLTQQLEEGLGIPRGEQTYYRTKEEEP